MKKIFTLTTFFIILLHVSTPTFGQYFRGETLDQQQQKIPGVQVYWLHEPQKKSESDEKGNFSIDMPSDSSTAKTWSLVCSFQNSKDTFDVDDLKSEWTFTLGVLVTLKEVKIKDARSGAYLSSLQVIKTEVINRMELRKAACCDLAGCFETQSTVQPQTTNILTNAKELRILGLSGVYNQVLVDGLPIIQGLTYTYGISTIPGSMLDNIWVVKGANSVVQGYENMVGQITVFPREGSKAEALTADVLLNSFGEKHLNTAYAKEGKNWSNYMAIHASLPGGKWDRDGDTFLDLPLLTRYSYYNKFRYRKENEIGFSAFVSGRFVDEKRVGGQRFFDPEQHKGSTLAYGQVVSFIQPELMSKAGYRFDENKKISYLTSLSSHNQRSWFGVLQYQANQLNWYQNLQWEQYWGKKKEHELKTGVSMRHWNHRQLIQFSSDIIPRSFDSLYIMKERVPGVFAENIFILKPSVWTLIAGIRADHHNEWGWKFTPRTMLRYQPFENTDIRLSAGTGWRTVNLFAENINLLTSGRDIVFSEAIRPEQSYNAGFNITQKWSVGSTDFTATLDAYHTRFQNQFFPDYDSIPTKALLYNFSKPSISNGIQMELSASYDKLLEIRVAYNYLDVFRMPSPDQKVSLPYNAKHKLLGVLSMHSREPKWQLDMNVHYYGVQRLPNTSQYPMEFRLPSNSKPFTILGLQYTHVFSKKFEVFTGCENLFDFRQLRPIMSWQNPFSSYFDTSFAFGPTRGREAYLGFRLRMNDKKQDESID